MTEWRVIKSVEYNACMRACVGHRTDLFLNYNIYSKWTIIKNHFWGMHLVICNFFLAQTLVYSQYLCLTTQKRQLLYNANAKAYIPTTKKMREKTFHIDVCYHPFTLYLKREKTNKHKSHKKQLVFTLYLTRFVVMKRQSVINALCCLYSFTCACNAMMQWCNNG